MFASPQNVRRTADPTTITGIWTWDVAANRIYGDAAVANLCKISPDIAQRGVHANFVLDKIHPEDRGLIQANIYAAVSNGSPGPLATTGYRIHYCEDVYIPVTLWGNSFANASGQIHQLAGVVNARISDEVRLADFMAASSVGGALDEIETFCRCAEALARSVCRPEVVNQLNRVIDALHSAPN